MCLEELLHCCSISSSTNVKRQETSCQFAVSCFARPPCALRQDTNATRSAGVVTPCRSNHQPGHPTTLHSWVLLQDDTTLIFIHPKSSLAYAPIHRKALIVLETPVAQIRLVFTSLLHFFITPGLYSFAHKICVITTGCIQYVFISSS